MNEKQSDDLMNIVLQSIKSLTNVDPMRSARKLNMIDIWWKNDTISFV